MSTSSKRNSFYNVILLVLIFFYFAYSLIGINNPWSESHHGFVGGEKSRPAIYYLKFGYLETKLGQLTNEEWELGKEKLNYNVHHPIGLPLLISFSFLTFGISEFSARLVIILVNLTTIMFLYLFVKEYWGRKYAILSIFFMILSPMFFYIRNFTATEVFVLPFMISLFYLYVKWLKTKNKEFLYISFFVFIVGAFLADWWIYFIPPSLIFHYYFFVKGKNRKILLFFPAIIFALLLYLFHVWVLTGSLIGKDSYWGNLLDRLLFRVNLDEASKTYNINFFNITGVIANNTVRYFTPILTYGTIAFILIYIIRLFKNKLDTKSGLLLTIFAIPVSILYIFSNITWIHDFFVLFFLLPIPVIFTNLIFGINDRFLKGRNYYFVILLIVVIFIFILSALPVYQQINEWFSSVNPLVKFVAENKGNFLVTFTEHPDNHQLRFYTDLRKVKQTDNRDELLKILETYPDDFEYIIVTPSKLTDSNIMSYLNTNFKKQTISDEYEVFYLK